MEVEEEGGAGRSQLEGAVECHRSDIVEILKISGLAPKGGPATIYQYKWVYRCPLEIMYYANALK